MKKNKKNEGDDIINSEENTPLLKKEKFNIFKDQESDTSSNKPLKNDLLDID